MVLPFFIGNGHLLDGNPKVLQASSKGDGLNALENLKF